MVRTYKKKVATGYSDYVGDLAAKERMENAINAVKNDGMPIARAAKTFDVPRSTLQGWLKSENPPGPPGVRPIYSIEEENGFVETIVSCCDFGYPLGINDLKLLVQDYNVKTRRSIPAFADNDNILKSTWVPKLPQDGVKSAGREFLKSMDSSKSLPLFSASIVFSRFLALE
jgi:hypothetical protein